MKNKILILLKKKLSNDRYEHTLRVNKMALFLANKYNVNIDKVDIASLLHDVCKEDEELNKEDFLKKLTNDKQVINTKNLWHAFTGAYYVENELGILDKEVIDAIKFHTIGAKNMTDVQKVIFISDYIEEGRMYNEIIEIRTSIEKYKNLNSLLKVVCEKQLKYFHEVKIKPHSNFLEMYDKVK